MVGGYQVGRGEGVQMMRMRILAVLISFALGCAGCAFQITNQGLQASVGTARAGTCSELEGGAESDDCHEARGAAVSEMGSNLIQAMFSPIELILRLLGKGATGV